MLYELELYLAKIDLYFFFLFLRKLIVVDILIGKRLVLLFRYSFILLTSYQWNEIIIER